MLDNVTEMYYAQARYYESGIGRFISEDLIKGFIEFPLSLNSYAYCWNQPMNFIDLDGLCRQCARAYMERYGPNDEDGNPQRNPTFPDFTRYGGNCANFVSQTLSHAGVSPISGEWHISPRIPNFFPDFMVEAAALTHRVIGRDIRFHNDTRVGVTRSWNVAYYQHRFFSNPDNGFINGYVIRIDANSDLEQILREYNIQIGDLLHMHFAGVRRIGHATIVSGVTDEDILLAGNTLNMLDRSLLAIIEGNPGIVLYLTRLNDHVFGEQDCVVE